MTKAVVLHSGGIDSTVALALAKKECGRENVLAVSFLYGQKHFKEIEASLAVCYQLGIQHRTINLGPSLFAGSAITQNGQEIPTGTYAEAQAGREGPISTYVPFRNGQLLSAATAIAVQEKAQYVYFGAHAGDWDKWAYPDCSPEWVGAMANAIYIGTDRQVRLRAPLVWMTKVEVVKLGASLYVPFNKTWSCYAGGEKHCNRCPTCLERKKAFLEAGVQDPTEYEEVC